MKRIGVQRTLLNLQLQYQSLWKRETKKKSYLNVFNELFQPPLIYVWNLEIREN